MSSFSLNKAKTKERRGRHFLLNATAEFAKGDPKNYLPLEAITRIADTYRAWRERENYSRIVSSEEIRKNDFNISPSRYIRTDVGQKYRPIDEIVEELDELEIEEKRANATLRKVLEALRI